MERMRDLDLGLIGNCNVAFLVDPRGEVLWGCVPHMDGDPVFCSLLRESSDSGFFSIELADYARGEQQYVANTAVLNTRLYDTRGGCVEIVDFAPRFHQFGRLFSPMSLVRQVHRLAGNPRITVRLRPALDYGAARADTTFGSSHVRYLCSNLVLRLTTDCSVSALVEEIPFVLQESLSFILGPDETLQEAPVDVARRFCDETVNYWRDWVRHLWIPFEWQEAVIRAAITLKLSAVDDTGAIVAAVTSSLPEAPDSGRNWDYRYCWLRDAYFTVNALNRVNATRTLERYLGYIINVAAASEGARLQPVYRINGLPEMEERTLAALPGYRGMGPVRAGNAACAQLQNDVYGSTVLAAAHAFVDRRHLWPGNRALFTVLENLGEHAASAWDAADAGMWELRGARRVHTLSSVMCWAACDRLSKIARYLGIESRALQWRETADLMRKSIYERAWNGKRGSFTATLDGDGLDAGLLLLAELGFAQADDPRFLGTVKAVEHELRRGDFVFRYSDADDFGVPQNAFVVCTYWYIDALAQTGRYHEALELFENLLRCRNRHGLLSEHIDPATRELWGNFPQSFSMVGLINSATRLSIPWDKAF
jgi:GH15 family glucan-1,4-alpha-glucosidase